MDGWRPMLLLLKTTHPNTNTRQLRPSPSAGHGNFLPWIGAEFGMSKSTVENFMNVSDALGNKIPIFGNLSASGTTFT